MDNSSNGLSTFFGLVFLAVIVFGIVKFSQARKSEGDWRLVKNLPASVQAVVAKMDTESQTTFFNELEKKRKSVAMMFLLWIIGWHYLYLGKIGTQFAFWFTGGGALIWWFVDAFRIPALARSANEASAREAIQTLAMGAAFNAPKG